MNDANDSSRVNWDLLPYRAQEFFGLEDGFDSKQLKRSYAALIKKYKPEKFPVEFQKIRRAYEILSSDIRYSHIDKGENVRSSNFSFENEQQAKSFEIGKTVSAIHQSKDVAAEYTRLREIKEKSAYDFFCLAFLSDFVDSEDSDAFSTWILEGISKHYHDPGLRSLALEYFLSTSDPEKLLNFIRVSAESIPFDHFLSITEPAWECIARECDFSRFQELAEEFEKHTDSARNHAASVFWIRLLKILMWKADRAWLDQKLDELEDEYFQFPYWLKNEFDMLAWLRRYKAHRNHLLEKKGKVTSLIDQGIMDWSSLPESVVNARILECQMRIASSGELLDEFASKEKDKGLEQSITIMVQVWDHISNECGLESNVALVNNSDHKTDVKHALVRITRRLERGFVYAIKLFATINTMLLGVTGIVIFVARCIRAVWYFGDGEIISGIGQIGLGLLIGLLFLSIAFFSLLLVNRSRRRYNAVRPELLNMVRAAPLPIRQLTQIMNSLEGEKIDDQDTILGLGDIIEKFDDDTAMHLSSLAHRSLAAA